MIIQTNVYVDSYGYPANFGTTVDEYGWDLDLIAQAIDIDDLGFADVAANI